MTFRSAIRSDVIVGAATFSNKKFILDPASAMVDLNFTSASAPKVAMFTLNPLPSQIPSDVLRLLEQVETATAGHILHTGFVDPAICAVSPEKRVAGTAVTIRIPHIDSTLLNHVVRLIRPGDIVVVDRCGDTRHACWGAVVSHAMQLAGARAAVIDGVATDFSEIRRIGFPLWCRGPSPITTKMLGIGGEFNVPVSIGGQTVLPGDAVLCDESGVLVLSPSEARKVAETAIKMQAEELKILARLHACEILPDISGATRLVEATLCKDGPES
jgi:regulator of RNase E activity RraA